MIWVISFMSGLIFGFGLIVSGMTDPAKVQGFLDIFGSWDPSLGLVMAGAILTGIFPFTWAKSRRSALLGAPMQLPVSKTMDRNLIIGASLFGIGWGMAGFCPGPAVTNLVAQDTEVSLFVIAMLTGMLLQQLCIKNPLSSRGKSRRNT